MIDTTENEVWGLKADITVWITRSSPRVSMLDVGIPVTDQEWQQSDGTCQTMETCVKICSDGECGVVAFLASVGSLR